MFNELNVQIVDWDMPAFSQTISLVVLKKDLL